ncbi:MAG: hypothetical protein GY866_35675, partial [Proteobacteria bacterium]|nr:hypothetical protein [Pseudomonadota bacterium]
MKMDKRFLEKIKELKFLLVAISLVLFLGCAASETEEETTGISTEDTTKPTIESLSPDDGAQNIATNTTISATFSEDMDSSSISDSTFYVKVSGGASISGTVSYGSKTATFDPDADLSTSTDYEATVTTGMTDEAGNALDQKKIWTFTTGAGADSTPPTVSSKTPADGATGIAINTDLTVTFSEGMLAGSFTASTFTLNDGSGNVTGIISVDVDTVTFKPNTDLNNDATYTATITTGVQDAAGNALAANEVWSFTTGAERAQFSIKASNVQQSDVAGDTAAGDTIKNVDVTHQRGDAEITINRALESGLSDCFELSRNADGSLRISGNKDRTTDECQLELGDIITVKADGFIDKQIVVDESMLDSRGTKVPLKEIESVQNFRLADLQEGRISARSSRGAHVVVEDDIVHFKTNNGAVTLTMPIAQVQRMARNVKRRLKNATADTEIRVETTSNKNPKKELDSWPTLDFDPSFETTTSPHYQPARATKRSPTAAERSENALVTVGMANIQMKTDDGTEIHCFSGQDAFNEETQGCDDEESASLKMKVSDDLFEQYAKKYNLGERKVPLYSYNEDTAQWVRQTKNNVELDGELTLEDNNQDQKASAGDVLYIEGEVGHFSYWNGDYPMERSCLEGTITSLGGEPLPDGTQVVVEGSDYTGRKFTKPLKADSGDFKNIAVKKNALAQVYLSYPNGEKSDIVYVTTGSESFVSTGPCQSTTEVGGTIDIDLISALSTKEIVVTVVNQNGGPLEEAAISTNFRTGTTNSSGQTALVISKTGVTNVSASYNTGTYQATANIEVDGSDTGATITLDTRSFDIGGLVKFTDENSQFSYPQGSVSVSVYGTEGYSFGYSPIASNGQYLVRLPRNAIAENTKVYIYTYAYSTRYAKYLYEYVEIDVTASQITANRITQDFDFVMKPFRVSGRVFDPMAAAGSQGIAGVNIWTSSGAYTTTNEDGFYQLLLFENTQAQLIYAWDNEMWEYALPQTTTKNYITIAANNTADKIDQNFIASRTPALI